MKGIKKNKNFCFIIVLKHQYIYIYAINKLTKYLFNSICGMYVSVYLIKKRKKIFFIYIFFLDSYFSNSN